MGNSDGGTAPRLSDNAPEGLRDFVAYRRMTVELDASESGWLPAPPGLPDGAEPSARSRSVREVATPL